MKVKRIGPECTAILYDGNYQSYLDMFNAIRAVYKNAIISAWERDRPVYILEPTTNSKKRIAVDDYVIIYPAEPEPSFVPYHIQTCGEEEFKENYEVIPGTD